LRGLLKVCRFEVDLERGSLLAVFTGFPPAVMTAAA
jgi:hypothetical protein